MLGRVAHVVKAGGKSMPIVGGGIDFALNKAMGEDTDEALFGAAGSTLGGIAGGALAGAAAGAAGGALFGGVGAIPGAVIGAGGAILGGMAGDAVAGKAWDMIDRDDDKKPKQNQQPEIKHATAGLGGSGSTSNNGDKNMQSGLPDWIPFQGKDSSDRAVDRMNQDVGNRANPIQDFGLNPEDMAANQMAMQNEIVQQGRETAREGARIRQAADMEKLNRELEANQATNLLNSYDKKFDQANNAANTILSARY